MGEATERYGFYKPTYNETEGPTGWYDDFVASLDAADAAIGAEIDGKSDDAHGHAESDISDLGAYPDATGQDTDLIPQTDGADGWTFIATPSGSGTDDQTAAEVAFTPAGDLAATDVQAALEELDTDKAATGHDHSGIYEPAGTTATHEADTTSVHGIADTSALYAAGGTDVAVADGGTGASDAGTALANLGASPDTHDHDGAYAAASHGTHVTAGSITATERATPRKIFETALGVWNADAPSRADYVDPIIFVGVTDPTDVTNGITTPANIAAGDSWEPRESHV